MSWRRVFPEMPTLAQILIQFLVFYRTHWIITIFTTARLTHTLSSNFFSLLILCSHTYSSLNNIAIGAHRFSALQMPCWNTKILLLSYNTILWDHCPICGRSLTKMSLHRAWLYDKYWTEVGIQFAVLYRPNSWQLCKTALNIYSSNLCFHPSNHNHDTKEAFMCHSVPVYLCDLFNPFQHSIHYSNANKIATHTIACSHTM
jgi:hypothetical protein